MAVVLITGCSSGFGFETALAFARRGDQVFATMRNLAKSTDLQSAAADSALAVEILPLDVTDDDSVADAVQKVLAAAGRIDVLVNNAGVEHWGALEFLADDLVRAIFETNVLGAVRMLRAVLPAMRAQESGVVVNVASAAGRVPGLPVNWAYSASKHALCSLSDSLSGEVQPFGVRVVSIEPGFYATRNIENATRPAPGSPYAELETAVVTFFENSLEHGGDPKNVAAAIVAAASDPSTPIHVPVGPDAEMFIQAAATMSESEWQAVGRAMIGLPPV
ncbi:MAG TPA: SDR family oxidoreductase [Acidimicrobiales bacterium]|jgi:NAD(P)-dependent dehydrogenase (short-subunit alcohol dehydrogenase family)|nr:SDR family oxidoreductase [Acidimicrobiales bacterium]